MVKDFYAVMGLDRDASDAEIKSAYRDAVKSYHPDVAGNNPEKTEIFKEMTEAYKVLSDPYRRKMHDQELPMKSYPLRRPTPEKVWKEVVDVILLRSDRVGQFHMALQAALPIALEEDRIILGFKDFRQASYLDVAADKRQLLSALELVMGKDYAYRYIQGENVADWERIKAGEERVAARSRTQAPRYASADKGESAWDDLFSRLTRGFNEMPRRHNHQSKAAYLLQALPWLEEVTLKAKADGFDEDFVEKQLARAIERLASIVDLPPVTVALELAKRRRQEGL